MDRLYLTDVDTCRGMKGIEMTDIGRVFVLAFDDNDGCACGNGLLEDYEAAYIDGELACEECVTEAKKVEAEAFFGSEF